jgi:hypothetical protein
MRNLLKLVCIACCVACCVLQAGVAVADERDDEIFGATNDGKEKKVADREAEMFGEEPATQKREDAIFGEKPKAASGQQLKAPSFDLEKKLIDLGTDRLQLGGLLYLRFNWNFTNGDELVDHPISMPNLVDLYFDGRPNDRVRGFVRGRLLWDPTVDDADPLVQMSGRSSVDVRLDELWLKFDIARFVYVTIGQQKVRWGATHFWNPIDVINRSQRELLSFFDDRSGVPLVKLHIPVESLGWNFYILGMLDRVTSLDKGGIAGRAEFVFSTIELGLTGAYRDDIDPRVGLDFSAGIWNFDLTAELGLAFDSRFEDKVAVQLAAGLQYTFSVFDDDMLIIGAEYFFNKEGKDEINPLDLFSGEAQFFYAGRHYASLFAALPAPGRLDDWSFTFSTIGNLSDRSFVARLDLSVKVLTYLTIQGYLAAHFGKQGELRLGDQAFPEEVRDVARALFSPDDPTQPIPSQQLDLGLWLRVDL